MNSASQSVPTIGILIMAVGMIAIMTIPFFLRSSLNKSVKLQPTEQRFRVTWRTFGRLALVVFWLVCGALSLGRIYHVPVIWLAISLFAFGLLSIGERRSEPGE